MKKDFFVSYTSADKTWAEWIAWQLEGAGYSVVIQAWDFRPGENFVVEMQTAAAEAERTLLVLSDDYLKSSFGRSEWAAAFAQDPTGAARRVVPVRVKPCEPDGLLRAIIFVDLVGLSDEDARTRLLEGVDHDRAKPETAPVFPGGAGRTRVPGLGQPIATLAALDEPVEPVTAAWSLLRQIGAGAIGLAVLALGSGALAEASYARLTGLDFEPALAAFALSGVQFFISLVIVLAGALRRGRARSCCSRGRSTRSRSAPSRAGTRSRWADGCSRSRCSCSGCRASRSCSCSAGRSARSRTCCRSRRSSPAAASAPRRRSWRRAARASTARPPSARPRSAWRSPGSSVGDASSTADPGAAGRGRASCRSCSRSRCT